MSSKNQSREKILEAATQLFHLQGYHATGLSQILKESGAPKGSLYYHFPEGKEQLALEAIERFGSIVSAEIRKHLNEVEDPIEAYEKHILHISHKFEDVSTLPNNSETLPIGLLAAETALVNENLRIKCEGVFNEWDSIHKEKLMASGFSEEQAQSISITINALIEGGITLCLTTKSNKPLLEIIKMIPLLFLK